MDATMDDKALHLPASLLLGRQWVARVTAFSSQWSDTRWGAHHLCGPFTVYPSYGDLDGAWAARPRNGSLEWLELEFELPQFIRCISLYETFNPGCLVKISARFDERSSWKVLWCGTADHRTAPLSRVFRPPLQQFDEHFRLVRLDIDQRLAQSWYELDAVEISDGVLEGKAPWRPDRHLTYPAPVRAAIKTLLLIWRRDRHPLSLLPREILWLVFDMVARPSDSAITTPTLIAPAPLILPIASAAGNAP